MKRLATCHDCRRPILWTITEAGKRLAVDPDPDSAGNTAVRCDGVGTWRSRRPTTELPINGWERLHMPHVATCPNRAEQLALPVGVTSLAEHRRKRRQ
ncbi:hypothetical protein RM704_10415 [Streptomyces sp. DSM 3412]|uniref:Uncharacterized protein n=1 Tax=Streptomyces gottesmaniae TaxID=3075518 RepID=A0ABU2YU73_9ACTN|nr:hypothetical protein [Streptomyces sp. DSM 3412]MDT0567877.1 hypothetical protein [Streptomyces sp. DSM 3412]